MLQEPQLEYAAMFVSQALATRRSKSPPRRLTGPAGSYACRSRPALEVQITEASCTGPTETQEPHSISAAGT